MKLERLWGEISELIPSGVCFGSDPVYEEKVRYYSPLLAALPSIDGWRPSAEPPELNSLAQNRLDIMDLGEPSVHIAVELAVEEPGRELRDYRFRFASKRRVLIREALASLSEKIDADLNVLRKIAGNDPEKNRKLDVEAWSDLREHLKQVEVLLGSTVKKPNRWYELLRHMRFGYISDLQDIESTDWPQVKVGLHQSLYGINEALPVRVKDLGSLVATKPSGPITTQLTWLNLLDEDLERLIFSLISNTTGYENPEWLMQTRAPDRGRDLSATRVIQDELSGTSRLRVVIQCKHWLKRSVSIPEIGAVKDQMATWTNPRVDVLVVATTGRFTADAVTWVEAHNANGTVPRIEMWPDSHLERLLAARPALIAEFRLRG